MYTVVGQQTVLNVLIVLIFLGLVPSVIAFLSILASETWALARFLPIIIGDLVPEDHECWNLFLLLLTILDYVMGPRCSRGIACYLCQQSIIHYLLNCILIVN